MGANNAVDVKAVTWRDGALASRRLARRRPCRRTGKPSKFAG